MPIASAFTQAHNDLRWTLSSALELPVCLTQDVCVQHDHADEKVGVFYCGPKSLGSTLNKHCKAATAASTATFTFAKENF